MTDAFGLAWPAPAKLNLMLRIVGRRPDGYHELQTVFRFIDLADTLQFRVRADGVLRRMRDLPGVSEQQDLVMRAARLLQRRGGTSLGADISLDKRIPVGAGLGGGSSDAATALVALNRLWGLDYTEDQLADLGLFLGADVPVFVRGRAAWAEGVGEKISPVDLPRAWYLVLFPDCHVSTAAVFNDPELTRNSARIKIADFLAGDQVNDCISVVSRRYPAVAEALRWLSEYARARLTGTGASVFAEFTDQASAQRVAEALPADLRGQVVRGLARSPLLDRLIQYDARSESCANQ